MAVISTLLSFLYILPGTPCEESCTVAQPPYAILSGAFIAILIAILALTYCIFHKRLLANTASLTKKIGTGLLLAIVLLWAISFYVPVKTATAPPGCARSSINEPNEAQYCSCNGISDKKRRLSFVKGENIFKITDLKASGQIPDSGDKGNAGSHYCMEGAVYQQYLF